MANAQAVMQMSQAFFQRNNPVDALVKQVTQLAYFLRTFRSQLKLMHFRLLLYRQQMQAIERNLQAGARAAKGQQVDRFY